MLGNQSFFAIFMKQYAEAEQYARKGLAVDSTQLFIYTNLAAALLFQGKYGEAEAIYRQYKSELKDSFLGDLKQFAEAGVIPKEREEDVEKIKKLLEE
jgi:predicted Zn-dependent protease